MTNNEDGTERALEAIRLTRKEVMDLCRQGLGSRGGSLALFEPLSGGAVNTTYRVQWGQVTYVLRLYIRDPKRCETDLAITRSVGSAVQIPEMVYADPTAQPYPFAFFRFVEGVPLQQAIEDRLLSRDLSFELGKVLATIHRFSFPEAGLFGPALSIETLFPKDSSPYLEYILHHFTEGCLDRLETSRTPGSRSAAICPNSQFPVSRDHHWRSTRSLGFQTGELALELYARNYRIGLGVCPFRKCNDRFCGTPKALS